MKKQVRKMLVLLCLAIVWTAVFGCAALADADFEALYAEKAPSIVQVYSMAEAWSRETGATVVEKAYATGLYIDERGYVLTAWHTISNADFVEVEAADGRRIRAAEILSDNSVDVAVLRLEEPLENTPALTLDDSVQPVPGMSVAAMANMDSAFGRVPVMITTGIVSAVNADSSNVSNFSRAVPLIRSNAAIGFGSCGGALFDENGSLIGMLVLQIDSEGYENGEIMSAAIPISTIVRVANDLIEFGSVQRPRMGIMVFDYDGPEEALKNYPPCGVLIDEVEENGSAGQAGLLKNDIITAIDGERVHSFNEMSIILEQHQAGDVITVTVYRCADPETGYLIDNPGYLDFEVTLLILD